MREGKVLCKRWQLLVNCCNYYDHIKGERGLLEWLKCQEYVIKSEQATHLKTHLVFLTPAVIPFSHLNTNSFNSQRQYLLCTKERGVQKDRLRGAKFLLDFLASPRASCKENISGKEWTSQQKQPADLAESSFMGLGKCGPNKIEVHLLLTIRRIFLWPFFGTMRLMKSSKQVNEGKVHPEREFNQDFGRLNQQLWGQISL